MMVAQVDSVLQETSLHQLTQVDSVHQVTSVMLLRQAQLQVDSVQVKETRSDLAILVDSEVQVISVVQAVSVPQETSVDLEVQVILVPQVASAQVSVLKDQVGTDLELRL